MLPENSIENYHGPFVQMSRLAYRIAGPSAFERLSRSACRIKRTRRSTWAAAIWLSFFRGAAQ